MELHRHLSQAWRELDRKWGEPVDLDSSDDFTPPSTLYETTSATFSSEEYLRNIRKSRPTPYSRRKPGDQERKIRIMKTLSRKPSSETNPSSYTSDSGLASVENHRKLRLRRDTFSLEDSFRHSRSTALPKKDSMVEAMKYLVQDLETPSEDSFSVGHFARGSTMTLDESAERRRLQFDDAFKQLKNAAISYVKKRYKKLTPEPNEVQWQLDLEETVFYV